MSDIHSGSGNFKMGQNSLLRPNSLYRMSSTAKDVTNINTDGLQLIKTLSQFDDDINEKNIKYFIKKNILEVDEKEQVDFFTEENLKKIKSYTINNVSQSYCTDNEKQMKAVYVESFI